jgi:hypothetical protein
VVLARRRTPRGGAASRYAYVADGAVEAFRERFEFGFEQTVDVARVARAPHYDLSAPLLARIWDSLAENPTLGDLAEVGRGIEFKRGCPVKRGGYSREILRYVEPSVLHHREPVPEKLVFTDEDVRRPGTAATAGKPQVVVNAASGSRGPWKIWTLMDEHGFATSKRLITIRPKQGRAEPPIDVLWAILTSPFANAFVHATSGKRDIDTKTYETLPMPQLRDLQACVGVERAVREYVTKARASDAAVLHSADALGHLKRLRLQIDAEVLKLYNLAPRDERALLDLFNGHRRLGVPFEQTEFLPQGFASCIPLHVYLTFREHASKASRLRKSKVWESLPDDFKQAVSEAAQPYADDTP